MTLLEETLHGHADQSSKQLQFSHVLVVRRGLLIRLTVLCLCAKNGSWHLRPSMPVKLPCMMMVTMALFRCARGCY